MSNPIRIQRKRVKGWKMPENTVSVTRPGRWGNPFIVTPRQDRVRCLERYRDWLNCDTELVEVLGLPPSRETIIEHLKGKNLACFCKEGDPCHGDILLKIANP